jgi:hypothetical protein
MSSQNAVTTYKQRDAWSRMVARDPRVKLSHRNVLGSLALCMRVNKQGNISCNPTYDALAAAALCDRRTAIRAVAAARELGILAKRNSDGRVSNNFDLLTPDGGSNGDKNMVFDGEKTDSNSGSNGDKSEPLSSPAQSSNGDSTCHCLKAKSTAGKISKNNKTDGALEAPRHVVSLSDSRVDNAANGTSETVAKNAAVDAPIPSAFDTERELLFQGLLATYPRRDAADAGRMVFNDLLDAGCNPALLYEQAYRYHVDQRSNGLKQYRRLDDWLLGETWATRYLAANLAETLENEGGDDNGGARSTHKGQRWATEAPLVRSIESLPSTPARQRRSVATCMWAGLNDGHRPTREALFASDRQP